MTSPRDPAAGLLDTLSADDAAVILEQSIGKCRKEFGEDDTARLLSIFGADMVEAQARHTLKLVADDIPEALKLTAGSPGPLYSAGWHTALQAVKQYLEITAREPGLSGDGSGTRTPRAEGE